MVNQPDFESLLQLLVNSNTKMVIVGAVAMNLRSSDYATFDLDICYERSPENVERLCRVLAPHCPAIRSAFTDTIDLLVNNQRSESFQTDFCKVALLGQVSGLGDYAVCLRFSGPVEFEDFTVQALTLEGLIKAKEAANRPKDQLHLVTLRALKEMEDEENRDPE